VKKVIATALLSITFVVASSHPAFAVEPLSARDLADHCEFVGTAPAGVDGIFCIRYIQGFIDGAIATDERVTLNVAEEYDREETFSERATRIRLGQRLASFGSSYYADFCLGAPVALAEVVDRVATELQQNPPATDSQLARDIVYMTLRKHYPCEKDG
jgi:hypothetical protein